MNSTNNKVKEKNKWFNCGMFITLFVNTMLGVGGWYVVNLHNKSRDIENKKREIKIEYLIKAYRSIQECSGYPIRDFTQASEKDIKRTEDLEQAMTDIQLFGSIYQVRKAREACKKAEPTMNDSGLIKFEWEADELLLDIRRELRKELLLEEIDPVEDKQEGVRKLRWSKIMEDFLATKKNQIP